MIFEPFYIFLSVMVFLAITVFIALQYIDAGYGITISKKWGRTINNKLAWFLMEFPIFFSMTVIWLASDHTIELVPLIFFLIFQLHYFQRVFIFPFILKGNGRMPIMIMSFGIIFNVINAIMQGYWIFYVAYDPTYPALFVTQGTDYLKSAPFIIGSIIFVFGFIINLRADYIIRHLRQGPDDKNHYFPNIGMFKYVCSANYFGELLEWLGFAILTWSISGLVFFIWTFANLVPRANARYKKYKERFPEEMKEYKGKRVIPFIY